ncbi:MAG TPA: hypothetical protein VMG81_03360 [Thermoplasmata archaeon]|nr:hypothetical protein [Thermoplasmata archaeon]
MADAAAGQPRKVWVVSFADGGVVHEPQVYETENGATAALAFYAEQVGAVYDKPSASWDFSECDDAARVDECVVRPGFLVR